MKQSNKNVKTSTNLLNIFCFNQTSQMYSKIYNSFFNVLLNNIYLEHKEMSRYNLIDLYVGDILLPKTGLTRITSKFSKSSTKGLFVLSQTTVDSNQARVFEISSSDVPFSWNDTSLTKMLFVWEQYYAPSFILLTNFCNWHAISLKDRSFLFKQRWIKSNINHLLFLFLMTRSLSLNFTSFVTVSTKDNFLTFLEKNYKSEWSALYKLIKINLDWSGLWQLNGDEDQTHSLFKTTNLIYGGWLQSTSSDLKKEIENWTFLKELELDPYKILFDFESDDIDFNVLDVYLWPWSDKLESDLYIVPHTLIVYDSFLHRGDVEGFEAVYFNIKGFNNKTPDTEGLLTYFLTLLDKSVWTNVAEWFDVFFPQEANLDRISKINWKFFSFIFNKIISRLNSWFLFGLQGFDRRNIFFRFFFFFILKSRGFFFKIFCIFLKQSSSNLFWATEAQYIIHILNQDQAFYIDVYTLIFTDITIDLKKTVQQKYPWFFFWAFFFENHISDIVLKKRDNLYPKFIENINHLLFKNVVIFLLYVCCVCVHIYFSIFLDFCKNPELCLYYIRLYEKKIHITKNISKISFNDYSLVKLFHVNQPIFEFLFLKKQIGLLKIKFDRGYKISYSNVMHLFMEYVSSFFFNCLTSAFILCASTFLNATALSLIDYFYRNRFYINPEAIEQIDSTVGFLPLLKNFNKSPNPQLKNQRSFFKSFRIYMNTFCYVFTLKKSFVFLIEFCYFYGITFLYSFLLIIYKFTWTLVYKYRLWMWSLKNKFFKKQSLLKEDKNIRKNKIMLEETDIFALSDAHKDYKVYIAYMKSKAIQSSFQPLFCKWFIKKLKHIQNPFLNVFWVDIQLWIASFLYYKKFKKKGALVRSRFDAFLTTITFTGLFNSVVFFKFWSFLFSLSYYICIRLFIVIIYLIIHFIGYFFVYLISFFWDIIVKILFIGSAILWLSFLYPLFRFLVLFFVVVFFFIKFFFFLFKALWLCNGYIIQFVLLKPLLFLIKKIKVLVLDFSFYFKYHFYIWSLYWYSFIDVTLLLMSFIGKVCIVLVLMLFQTLRFLYKRFFKVGDYTDNFYTFFSQEKQIFLLNVSELIFVLSFCIKILCLVLGFIFFVVGGVGWKMVSFFYSDGSEQLKIESTDKKAYMFLDKWVVFFTLYLFQFNLNYKSWLFWVFYNITDFILYCLSFFWYCFIYCAYFCYYFFLDYKIIQQNINKIRFLFGIINNKKILNFFYFITFSPIITLVSKKKTGFYKKKNISFYLLFLNWVLLSTLQFRLVFWLQKSLNFIFNRQKLSKPFLIMLNQLLKDTVLLRDVQEFLVFISLTYNWSTFYWAILLQLSMEIGEFGWWATYKKKIHNNKSTYFRFDIFSSILRNRFSFYDENVNSFSKKHAYYLVLNNLLKPITRYKPYIINSFYHNKTKVPYKNSLLFRKHAFFKYILRKISLWFGFSFLFEILMLRFQQPISRFLFGEKGFDFHLPFSIRLKFFKDIFSEFTWLTKYTYFTTRQSLDHFLWVLISTLRYQIKGKSFYFKKFRNSWFLSLLNRKVQNYTSFFPQKKWSIILLFTSFFKNLNIVILYSIFLIFFFFLVCVFTFIILLALSLLILKIGFHFLSNLFFILFRIK